MPSTAPNCRQKASLLWRCRMNSSRECATTFPPPNIQICRSILHSMAGGCAICGLNNLSKPRERRANKQAVCSRYRRGVRTTRPVFVAPAAPCRLTRMGCRHPPLAHAVAAGPAGRAAVFPYLSCLQFFPAKARAPSPYSAFLPPPNRQTQRRKTSHRL